MLMDLFQLKGKTSVHVNIHCIFNMLDKVHTCFEEINLIMECLTLLIPPLSDTALIILVIDHSVGLPCIDWLWNRFIQEAEPPKLSILGPTRK